MNIDRRSAIGIGGLVALGIAWPATSRASEGIDQDAAAFGALPQIDAPAVSPDGAMVAWIDAVAGANRAIISTLATGVLRAVPLGAAKPRWIEWAASDVILVTVSVTATWAGAAPPRRFERVRVIAIDLKTETPRLIEAGANSKINSAVVVSGIAPDKSGDVFVPVLEFMATAYQQTTGSKIREMQRRDVIADAFLYSIYRVNPRTGTTKVHVRGDADTKSFMLGLNGEAVLRDDFDERTNRQTILLRDGARWKSVLTESSTSVRSLTLAGLEPGGAGGLVLDARGDMQIFKRIDLQSGAVSDFALPEGLSSIESYRVDAASGIVVSVRGKGINAQAVWLVPALAAHQQKLNRAFKGKTVTLRQWTPDMTHLVLSVGAASDPEIYYLLSGAKADVISETYPQLLGRSFGEKRMITYPARDGVGVPAFLTVPAGAKSGPGELVVLPHGGPEAHDDSSFDFWAQFLAARGYLVLQPQFRGSSGFGKAWADAGRGQWGRRMQDDVSDGVAYAIKAGLADPKRVAIVGASYGGYAALAGATLTPELYAAAVSVAGVSDLAAFLGDRRARGGAISEVVAYWEAHIGDDRGQIAAISPINHVAQVRAPVLLIHGKDDTVVPFAQSTAMAKALKDAGKTVKLVELPGEDHWLSLAITRTQMLAEVGRFLATTVAT